MPTPASQRAMPPANNLSSMVWQRAVCPSRTISPLCGSKVRKICSISRWACFWWFILISPKCQWQADAAQSCAAPIRHRRQSEFFLGRCIVPVPSAGSFTGEPEADRLLADSPKDLADYNPRPISPSDAGADDTAYHCTLSRVMAKRRAAPLFGQQESLRQDCVVSSSRFFRCRSFGQEGTCKTGIQLSRFMRRILPFTI